MIYEAKFYTKAPLTTDKNAIATDRGGYSHCIVRDQSTGYTLPNCVAFVHAQWLYQATAAFDVEYAKALEAKMCRKNAEVYWGYDDGFERGQTPRKGAIICWRKGKIGASDGAGHVAVVRDVHENGDVTVVASNYSGAKFYVATYRAAKNYYLGSTYTFQGFIYLPFTIADYVTVPLERDVTRDQVEVTISNLNVRTEPNVKAHRQGYAAKGVYNVLETSRGIGYTWYRIDDGLWVAAVEGVIYHDRLVPPDPVERDRSREQVLVTISNLNVRAGYGLSAVRVGYCKEGLFNVYETVHENPYDWHRISEDGCWIARVQGVQPPPREYDVLFKGVSAKDLVSLKAVAEQLEVEVEVTEL